ncbi:phospholipid N-methyltransferase [Streptosporangium album]|uniref:Phospholipid N-methyltransferase n=1 Tax=Streptosporangium album TaxID=47479 RepID=A0A7W7WAP1_9ACTN|nr:methyltransferase domain-containing protein [Streptosporangium album]MBB4940138.1 phospholipid N-methyltransferase [Streptosporangium album]
MNETVVAPDLRAFMSVALRKQGVVGAVAPSSPALARALTAVVPTRGTPVVVELGPGTGSISEVIRERLPPGSRHLAVEIEPVLAAHLRRTKPWMETIQGDAADLGALLAGAGVERADAVVSTLPWSLFPGGQQERILGEIGRILDPAGAFTTVTYLHAVPLAGARALRRRLRATFDEVLTTGPVWRNLPPGMTYVCRRPVARV